MNSGYVKLYRKLLDNPVVCKDPDHIAVWIYLLLNATHKEVDVYFQNERITLCAGQLITSRKSISTAMKVQESKVERVLKRLKNEQQIEQRSSSQNRLITILNWQDYQQSEQQDEQQVNSNRTASEHKQECKNVIIGSIYSRVDTENGHLSGQTVDKSTPEKQDDSSEFVKQVVDHLNMKTGSSYRPSTKKTRSYILARHKEGYTLDDFVAVIDKKTLEWKGTNYAQYLRPETLFAPSKFESYLNQPAVSPKKSRSGAGGFEQREYNNDFLNNLFTDVDAE